MGSPESPGFTDQMLEAGERVIQAQQAEEEAAKLACRHDNDLALYNAWAKARAALEQARSEYFNLMDSCRRSLRSAEADPGRC